MDPTDLVSVVPALGWAVHSGLLTRRLTTARRDPLTGLHTRAGFTARAERLLTRHPEAALVLLIDLDDFKAINDTFGHAAGDTVLTATATRLTDWCGHTGIPARLGGDEFTAITTDPTAAPRLPGLRAALNTTVQHAGHPLPVSASVGVCHVADLPIPTLTDALTAADTAMYQAKGHHHRNTHR
ncbi:GGDEF domain-containing protein [Actinacidiphila sp. bgisy144]|uniref:GGDEF domain-containing protein n=1 Tax=Actinacidiphila sp. bgisy144 TaxID=3413791 RepID=UPI003EBA4482